MLHDRVKASGEGHSWNQPFFCVHPGASLGRLPPSQLRAAHAAVSDDVLRRPETTSPAVPTPAPEPLPRPSAANILMTTLRPLRIELDPAEEAVWVDAGVRVVDLLMCVCAQGACAYTHTLTPRFRMIVTRHDLQYNTPGSPFHAHQVLGCCSERRSPIRVDATCIPMVRPAVVSSAFLNDAVTRTRASKSRIDAHSAASRR